MTALLTQPLSILRVYLLLRMSGAEGGGFGRKGLLASLMGTLRRSSARQEQPKPVPEDLGLKTLRHVSFILKIYAQYRAVIIVH